MSGRKARTGRWTITAGATLIAVGVLSFNAWANFTATATTSNSISTGDMKINLADGPTAFSVDVTGMVPGDHAERFVDMDTTGSTVTMQNIKLAAAATSSSVLDTDGTNGLQLQVDNCTVPWTPHAGATATCTGGTSSSVKAQAAVIFSATTMNNVHVDGTTDHLRFQWYLPATADDTFRGKTSVIQYTFTGTQPANTYH